jgi:tetratricopeptide (TPR) repeat protein
MAKPELTEWDEDLTASANEEYDALVRAIRWARGFGLLFVQCTPAEGERLMARVQADITDKTVDVLRLEGEVDDLYATVADLPNISKTNVLFVTGLEKSLVPYIKLGYGSEGDYYAKDTVPKLLGKLNLQREKFRETFGLCFVFLVPPYAMKYLIRRAADFFDWRSGVWEFVGSAELVRQESLKFLQDNDFEQYRNLTLLQCRERFLAIEDFLEQGSCPAGSASELRREQGRLLIAEKNYESALSYFEKALKIQADYSNALKSKGDALSYLSRYEEAIVNYDAALTIDPDFYEALSNKGFSLSQLKCYEEAIVNYNAALAINSDYYYALNNKGNALGNLGRYEQAIACYDAALAIKPNYYYALNNKGNALGNLGRYEQAIASYDAALAIKPNYHETLNNKGNALSDLGRYEDAIASYDAALTIKPDYHEALNNKGIVLRKLGRYEEAITSYEAALAIKPDKHEALNNKGIVLRKLGRYEEAITSYDAALAIKPRSHEVLYNKGYVLDELVLDGINKASIYEVRGLPV